MLYYEFKITSQLSPVQIERMVNCNYHFARYVFDGQFKLFFKIAFEDVHCVALDKVGALVDDTRNPDHVMLPVEVRMQLLVGLKK